MAADLKVKRLAGALGAQIEGLDLAQPLSACQAQDLNRQLVDHGVLVLRDQALDPARLVALTRSLGQPLRLPFIEPLADFPEVIAVLKEADETNISTFGGTWHSDFSFLPRPPRATLLYAKETPPQGGDTLWANMCLAYERLSPGLRALLDGLWAIHSGAPYGRVAAPPAGPWLFRARSR